MENLCHYTPKPPRPQPQWVGYLGLWLVNVAPPRWGASNIDHHEDVVGWCCVAPIQPFVELRTPGVTPNFKAKTGS
jgi:hypothetical protein